MSARPQRRPTRPLDELPSGRPNCDSMSSESHSPRQPARDVTLLTFPCHFRQPSRLPPCLHPSWIVLGYRQGITLSASPGPALHPVRRPRAAVIRNTFPKKLNRLKAIHPLWDRGRTSRGNDPMPNDELMASLFRSSGSFTPARNVEEVPDALLLDRFVDQWDRAGARGRRTPPGPTDRRTAPVAARRARPPRTGPG